MALPTLDPTSAEATGHHLLVLPHDVGPEEVEILAVSRFPRATWMVPVATVPVRPSGGTRGRRVNVPPPGVLRLSRHSTLHGPYTLGPDAGAALALPASAGTVYVVHAPVERGARPWPTGGDRDGLHRAFPDGLPVRDEARTLTWLVAAARRLGGAVRVAPSRTGSPGVLLVPEPAAAVDLTVWTDIWLEPDAAISVVRQALPRAALNLPTGRWDGPPPGTGERPVPGAEDLDPDRRRALHRAADQRDMAVLRDPPPMQAYGALADLDGDGMLAVEISGETRLPPVISAVPWAARGAVAYRVRWEPVDLADRESERPSVGHRVARGRATPLVIAVTRALHGAVGGEITDAMDFVVDPADL